MSDLHVMSTEEFHEFLGLETTPTCIGMKLQTATQLSFAETTALLLIYQARRDNKLALARRIAEVSEAAKAYADSVRAEAQAKKAAGDKSVIVPNMDDTKATVKSMVDADEKIQELELLDEDLEIKRQVRQARIDHLRALRQDCDVIARALLGEKAVS